MYDCILESQKFKVGREGGRDVEGEREREGRRERERDTMIE